MKTVTPSAARRPQPRGGKGGKPRFCFFCGVLYPMISNTMCFVLLSRLLFLGVRQVAVLLLAKCAEIFFIDILSVRSKFSVRVLGPWATLFILQTKGFPFIVFMWGILSVGLLSGTKPFFHHWGYWQDYIDLFNENNPSGEVGKCLASCMMHGKDRACGTHIFPFQSIRNGITGSPPLQWLWVSSFPSNDSGWVCILVAKPTVGDG